MQCFKIFKAHVENTCISAAPVQANTPVAFHVQLQRHQSTLGTIKFDRVVYEIGGVWNLVTGHFILPLSGIYCFQLTLVASNNNIAVGQIRKDNTNLQVAHATSQSGGSAMVVMNFNQYDQMSGNLDYGVVYGQGRGGMYTHFTGFLVSRS